MRTFILPALVLASLAGSPPIAMGAEPEAVEPAVELVAVLETYADIAEAAYGDSLAGARALDLALQALAETPSEATHDAAKEAWLEARVPYQQTEVFRFANPIVDAWEGRVNAWPLDEGLIDYVAGDEAAADLAENSFGAANVIANPILEVAGTTLDATTIDAALLAALHEIDEVEANVSRGYHAIEFLLWGQDLNGTGAGAGERPWTDFAIDDSCTGENCDRRRAYLLAASALLVADLEEMTEAWQVGGAARQDLVAEGEQAAVERIFTGLGSLAYGELAGERMQLGLLLHDPEEEHDCFADNTHNSHFYNVVGMRNVYFGTYTPATGERISGPSLGDLVKAKDAKLDTEFTSRLNGTLLAFAEVKETADSGAMAYDQMLGENNSRGNAMLQAAIDALIEQTRTLEEVVAALQLSGVDIEGSDSLDSPGAVFQ